MSRDKLLTAADRFFDFATRAELALAALALPALILAAQGFGRIGLLAFAWLSAVALFLVLAQGMVLAVCTRAISVQVEKEARKNPVHVDGATGRVVSSGRKGFRNYQGGTPPGPKAGKSARRDNPLSVMPLGRTTVTRPN